MSAPATERLPDVGLLFPFRAWLRHPALRTTTTWLFVALVVVPPAALTVFRDSADMDQVVWVFAAYFAAAWFLVLKVLVRPQNVPGALLAQLCVIALLIEAPLAIWLENVLGADPENLATSILAIGVPEELAKMLPVVALTLIYRSRRVMSPRDTLFLGAVSGLVFGAGEAVGFVDLYGQLDGSGTAGAVISVWRFLTDPIAHALWAGVAGYFVGLAAQYRTPSRWFALAGIGLGVPAVLHGVNDWIGLNVGWVSVAVVSTVLFLAYARIGLVAAPAPAARRPMDVDPPTMPVALPHLAPTGGRHATR